MNLEISLNLGKQQHQVQDRRRQLTEDKSDFSREKFRKSGKIVVAVVGAGKGEARCVPGWVAGLEPATAAAAQTPATPCRMSSSERATYRAGKTENKHATFG